MTDDSDGLMFCKGKFYVDLGIKEMANTNLLSLPPPFLYFMTPFYDWIVVLNNKDVVLLIFN